MGPKYIEVGGFSRGVRKVRSGRGEIMEKKTINLNLRLNAHTLLLYCTGKHVQLWRQAFPPASRVRDRKAPV